MSQSLPVRVYAKAKNRILDDWVNSVGGQQNAAKILGVSTRTISQWLNFKSVPGGRYSTKRLQRLATTLAKETGHSIREIFPLPEEAIAKLSEVRVKDVDVPLAQITDEVERMKLSYEPDVSDGIVAEEIAEELNKAMKKLSHREREVFKLRHGELFGLDSYSLDEVAHIFKVTRERIRQIEAKAIYKLQSYMPTWLRPPEPAGEILEPAERWPSEIFGG